MSTATTNNWCTTKFLDELPWFNGKLNDRGTCFVCNRLTYVSEFCVTGDGEAIVTLACGHVIKIGERFDE